ncbi:MAG: hypothetical protein ACP5N5_03455 [Desulfurococcus sp.]
MSSYIPGINYIFVDDADESDLFPALKDEAFKGEIEADGGAGYNIIIFQVT